MATMERVGDEAPPHGIPRPTNEWAAIHGASTDKADGCYLLAIGDAAGIARAWTYSDGDPAQRAERDAVAYLGRDWQGGARLISVAQVFTAVAGRWQFVEELEY